MDNLGDGAYLMATQQILAALRPVAIFTKALLHLDGADASTTFTDETGKTWTGNGNAQIDTAQSVFGGASLLLDGSGDSLVSGTSADFTLGTGDFTLECWVRPANTTSAYRAIIADGLYGSTGGFALYQNGTNLEAWRGGSPAASIIIATSALTASTWQHVAWTRSGSDNRLFVAGTQVGSTATNSTNFTSTTARIGQVNSGLFFNGHIDECRITKGLARYTANFTPPSFPFVLD